MAITTRADGHLWWAADLSHQDALGLQSSRLDECIELVRTQQLRGVFGRAPEFTERNVDFLAELPDLEEVQLYDIELADLEGLYQLPRLRYLRISGKRPAIDFSRLPTLTSLVVEHRPKDRGFAELAQLSMMHSWRYKPAQAAMFDLTLPASLRELMIAWSPMETLSPLGPLPNLRSLCLARCRNLRDLGDLKVNFPNLEQLTIEACGRLSADEADRAIAGHPGLLHASAANKLLRRSERNEAG